MRGVRLSWLFALPVSLNVIFISVFLLGWVAPNVKTTFMPQIETWWGSWIAREWGWVWRQKYSVYVGKRVSLAHQWQMHGPAKVGDDTYIGMQALIFQTEFGDHVVVEPGAKLIGVKVASGRYGPALSIITRQAQADLLPAVTADYPYRRLNQGVVRECSIGSGDQPQPVSR